jgi:hypothetical protein
MIWRLQPGVALLKRQSNVLLFGGDDRIGLGLGLDLFRFYWRLDKRRCRWRLKLAEGFVKSRKSLTVRLFLANHLNLCSDADPGIDRVSRGLS